MNEADRKALTEQVAGIVGEANVMVDPLVLDNYSRDMTVEPPSLPDLVVMPQTVEEVQAVVRIANERKVAIVPFVTGTNLGGLTIPRRGGMIMDLKRMNRILEVNEDSMYTVVEPGVSFGDMEHFLKRNHPGLKISQPAAPAFTSVVANYLLGGLGTLAMKAGCHGDMINGLEAVLPTGERIRTGSVSASPYWFSRHPLPDFCGLFIDWKGTSGIVTKASIQLWPAQPFEDYYAVGIWDIDYVPAVLGRIVKAEISEEQSGRTREVIEVGLGMYKTGERQVPWDILVMHRISASTKKLFDAKVEALEEILKDETDKGRRAEILWDFSANDLARRVSEFPTTGFAVTWMDYGRGGEKKPGGGASWVGGYGTLEQFPGGIKKAREIMERHNFATMGTQRTMGLGRYSIMRFLIPYNRRDAEEVKEVREMMKELARMELDQGALMYKAPEWATGMMMEKADPGYLDLLKRIKKLLDPNDIMNPGKLGI
jgi:glycolate oxidase